MRESIGCGCGGVFDAARCPNCGTDHRRRVEAETVARIVAWLRRCSLDGPGQTDIADVIERGEWRK